MPLEEWEEKLVPGQEVSMRWLCFTVKIENKTFATIGDFQVESLTHRLQQHFRCRPLNAAAGTPASLEPRPRPQGRLLIKAHQQGAAARRAEGAGTCCPPSPPPSQHRPSHVRLLPQVPDLNMELTDDMLERVGDSRGPSPANEWSDTAAGRIVCLRAVILRSAH